MGGAGRGWPCDSNAMLVCQFKNSDGGKLHVAAAASVIERKDAMDC